MTEASADTRSPQFGNDAAVRTYTSIHLPRIFVPWTRVLLEVLPPRPGEAVLDVATGPGTVARQAAVLVGEQGRVCGVDLSAAMLGVGRAWPPEPGAAEIEYVESSATAMPLPDAAFDVAYCQQGLQHMSEPLAALREMRRLLKPGGRLGVALWVRSPFGLFRQVVLDLGLTDAGAQPSTFGRDATELAEVLRELGFEDVQVVARELVSVFEGGISQALEVAEATSTPNLAPEQRQAVREAIADRLQPHLNGTAIHLPSAANIASARAPR